MNSEEARKQLHLPTDVIAINAGSWGPLSEAARDAINQAYLEEAASRGDNPEYMKEKGSGLTRYSEVVSDAKSVLSRFLGCASDEIALCDSTTSGMNIFLWGYEWERGDQIIAGNLENPAAKVPLMVLAQRRGVDLVYIDSLRTEEELMDALSSRTRMVLLSDVNFATGSRVDLQKISSEVHKHDALLLADGIQAVGNHHVDVKELGIDGYALARHKFLCGPDGAGALYVSKKAQELIHPTYSGVFTDQHHGSGELQPMPSAQKYEVSTRALPVIMGGTAATKWIMNEVGLEWIVDYTSKLYNRLWDALNEMSHIELVSERNQNSLLSFRVHNYESADVVERLRENNIFTRTVGDLSPSPVRLSIGFWNRASDMDRITETLSFLS
jgi:L-cysteine/cystine lyase